MKKIAWTFFLVTFITLASQNLHAQDRGLGIGAAIGGDAGSGLSWKTWVSDKAGVSGMVTFRISEFNSSFYTHVDYVVHGFFDQLDWEPGTLHYYYGGGVGYRWFDAISDDILSLRVPAGIGFNFAEVPVDLFFELAPTANVSPDFSFYFNGNMGFRFYLN